MGAAPTGPGGSKKRLATATDARTQKKARTSKENDRPGEKRTALAQEGVEC